MQDRSNIYVVEGRWPFPLDMLRRDCSMPATPEDARLVERLSASDLGSSEDLVPCRVVLRLGDGIRRSTVAEDRWASFRWHVVDGRNEAVQAARQGIEKNYRSAIAKLTNEEIEALEWHGLDARH